MGSVNAVDGLLCLAHEDVGGDPLVACPARQFERVGEPVSGCADISEIVGGPRSKLRPPRLNRQKTWLEVVRRLMSITANNS